MSWGNAVSDGTSTTLRRWPTALAGLANVVAVAAGETHSLALTSSGEVYAWGSNADGELGDGATSTSVRHAPVRVVGLQGVTKIAAGDRFSVALVTDGADGGSVWTWGRNQYGQLGEGTTLTRVTPVKVAGLPAIREVRAGRASVTAVGSDGRVWSWGRNHYGQLGLGTTADSLIPQPAFAVNEAADTSSGQDFAFVLDRWGRPWAVGYNGDGQFGLGHNVNGLVLQPTSEAGLIVDAGLGQSASIILRSDGSVWAAGKNTGGQLGNGTTTFSMTWVATSGLSLANNAWLISDADEDGLSAWQEYRLGTDSLNPDSNGNGLLDGVDARSGESAANPDTDGDGSANWHELQRGTDPFRADTDGDGVADGIDVFPLDPSRSQLPAPTPGDTTPPVITLTEPVSARPVPPL